MSEFKKESVEDIASRLAIENVKEYMKIFPDCINTFDYRKGFERGFELGNERQQINCELLEMLEMLQNSNDYLKDLINEYGIESSEINNHVSKLKQLIKEK